KAAGEIGGWQNVIITLIGLKVASWVLGLTKALNGPGGLLFAICSLVSLMICTVMTIVASRNRGWLLLPIVYAFALINLAFATFMP
ncbi:inner membrane protein YpjD, partial [Salmonella enterica subsp. enterica serovar Anatum]|nr:inner membrane protein YpjD [Salmonella enterica subsp. enterica serovar Anatum]